MLMFLKVTLYVEPLLQKHAYQVFQWMICLAESHGQMNLPGKSSRTSAFKGATFSGKGTRVVW